MARRAVKRHGCPNRQGRPHVFTSSARYASEPEEAKRVICSWCGTPRAPSTNPVAKVERFR